MEHIRVQSYKLVVWCTLFLVVGSIGADLGSAQILEPTLEELDIFYYGLSDTCQPPCWNGVRVGVSSFPETIRTFGEFFAFSSGLKRSRLSDSTTETWFFSHDIRDTPLDRAYDSGVRVAGTFVEDTLFSLHFSWRNTATRMMPIQRVITSFGEPSEVVVGVSGGGKNGYALAGIWLAYHEHHVYFSYSTKLLVDPAFANDPPEETAYELCFNQEAWIEAEYSPFAGVEIHNGVPENWVNPAESLRHNVFYIRYLQDASEFTASEFTELFLEAETPCIQLNSEAFVEDLAG
jgi:hypothetical protein